MGVQGSIAFITICILACLLRRFQLKLRAPRSGNAIIQDVVQGKVSWHKWRPDKTNPNTGGTDSRGPRDAASSPQQSRKERIIWDVDQVQLNVDTWFEEHRSSLENMMPVPQSPTSPLLQLG